MSSQRCRPCSPDRASVRASICQARPVASDEVRVEILGSGGAATIPRPGCRCRVCVEAREKGGRYARTGPSTFVHGPNILFDTPEESKLQLERAGIGEIAACFYSHWHPGPHDGAARLGDPQRRLPHLAARGEAPARHRRLPAEQVAARLPHAGSAAWRTSSSCATAAGSGSTSSATATTVEIGGVTRASVPARRGLRLRLRADATASRRLLVAMDELNGWSPPPRRHGLRPRRARRWGSASSTSSPASA